MFILKSTHNKILDEKNKFIKTLLSDIDDHYKTIRELKTEKNSTMMKLLDRITEKLVYTHTSGNVLCTSDSGLYIQEDAFTTDMVTWKKIFKDNGIKCIKIDKQGKIDEWFTEQEPIVGEYVLIQE